MTSFIMRRHLCLLLTFCAALACASCGDPIFVLGDTPGEMRVVAGRADSVGTRVDTLATRTRFTSVSAVAFDDASSLLYVADRGGFRQISGITTTVARIFSITSTGRLRPVLEAGGCAAAPPCLLQPAAMVVVNGSLLIADAVGHRVYRFDPVAGSLVVVAGNGVNAPATEGLQADATPISAPVGIAVGPAGIYVSERNAHRVWLIGEDGTYTAVAGGGATEVSTIAQPAGDARLREPAGLALRDSLLYIAGTGSHSVDVMNVESGMIRRVAGDGIEGFAGDGGSATAARLRSPRDVSLDAAGSLLYIADTGNHRVRVLNLAAGTINTFAGTGSTIYNGDRQAAGNTALSNPVDLAGSSRPLLFIVDQGHAIVRRAALGF
jgi:DNA-binding beta-propeller fold protein YncE